MQRVNLRTNCALALALAGMLSIGSVLADKPSGGGKVKHDKGERRDADERSSRDSGKRDHFENRHRLGVNEYYSEQHRAGRCPPGLAKKDNGCMPPGQAKKWQIGEPLRRDVVHYTVPKPVVSQLGQPPAGYRYVRVGSDILLMKTRTRTIVDAIQNLGRS